MPKNFIRFSQALLVFGLLLSLVAGYAMDRFWHDRQLSEFKLKADALMELTEQRMTNIQTRIKIAFNQYETGQIPNFKGYLKDLQAMGVEQIDLIKKMPPNPTDQPFAPDWSRLLVSKQANGTSQMLLTWHVVLYPLGSDNDNPVEAVEACFNLGKLFDSTFNKINLGEFKVKIYIEGPYINERFSHFEPIYATVTAGQAETSEFTRDNQNNKPIEIKLADNDLHVILYAAPSAWESHWPALAVFALASLVTWFLFRIQQSLYTRLLQAHERTLALYERGEAVAFIAHELPQPLTGIIGCLESSLSRLRDGNAAEGILLRDLEQAHASAKRTAIFLKDIKTHIQQDQSSDTMEPVAIASLLQSTVALAELDPRLQGIKLHILADVSGVQVMACPIALEMVLLNLLRNSAEAIRDTGQGDSITLEAGTDGENVMLRVTDDGPGISRPEDLFQPFKSTKPYGSGLGLVYCERQVVKRFGGKIRDQNRLPPEHGACFTITLPRWRS